MESSIWTLERVCGHAVECFCFFRNTDDATAPWSGLTSICLLFVLVSQGPLIQWSAVTCAGVLGAAVYGFDESAWDHNDGREFGPCTSVTHWKKLLSAAGFTEVSVVR